MKRFLACLAMIFAALAVTAGGGFLHQEEGAQVVSHDCASVFCEDCGMVFQNTQHSVAFAENGTFTQVVTSVNYSPWSSFPTVTITRNIPSPSYEGHGVALGNHHVVVRISPVHTKFYVLRV